MHWSLIVILHSCLVYNLAVFYSEISKAKPSRQSHAEVGFESWRAFDGNPLTYSSTNGSSEGEAGWIQVDLGGFYNIREVVVTSAPGNDSEYLVNFQVLVGATDQVIPEWMACFVYAALPPLRPGANYSSKCDHDLTIGRYVTLLKHGGPDKSTIAAAEIMVYGFPSIPAINLLENVVNVDQNFKDFYNYGARNALDGNIYTCAFTASNVVSSRNYSGWWQADFGKPKRVTSFLIANVRTEYFRAFDYMREFVILVSNDSDRQLIEKDTCFLYNSSELYTATILFLPCTKPMIGRYISVINLHPYEVSERMDTLTICEFYAFDSDEGFKLPVTSTVTSTVTPTKMSTTISTIIPSTTVSTVIPSTTISTVIPTTTSTITTDVTTIKSTTITVEISSTRTLSFPLTTSHTTLYDETTSQLVITTFTKNSSTSKSTLPTTTSRTTARATALTFELTTPSGSKTTTAAIFEPPETDAPTTVAKNRPITTGALSREVTHQTTTYILPNNSLNGNDMSMKDDSRLRLGLGIGLGLGLGLLLLLTIFLILLFCCFLKKRKTQKVPVDNISDESPKIDYVHPRTRLAPPRSIAFDGVDFSYVPDLNWEGSEV